MTGGQQTILRAGLAALLLLAARVASGGARLEVPAQAAVPTREVIDETNRRVRVPVEVRRIVSLAPNLTEILYALGVEDRLVAVSDYSDYPPAAEAKLRVGKPLSPSLEQVAALRPDLVLATTAINRRETVESLERLGIPVYAADPRTVEGMLESVQRIAGLVGAVAAGRDLAARLRGRLAELKQRLAGRPPKRVLFVVWEEPLITAGPNTFLADALRRAGAEPVVEARQDWPRISLEEVVRLQPDYLVFAASHSETPESTTAALRERPGWRELAAVREGRIAVVSDAVNRPSPRLVDAIEQLARELFPDAFVTKAENRDSKSETWPQEGGRSRFCASNRDFRLSNFEFRVCTCGR